MKYTIEYLPKYQTKTPGKYDDWSKLNNKILGFPPIINISNCNYRINYHK